MTRYAASIRRLPSCAVVELRGDRSVAERCLAAANLPWPTLRNRRTEAADDCAVLWVGPQRWLVIGPSSIESRLEAGLLAAVAQEPALLGALVSDAFVGFAIDGSEAGEIMAQGTPLDISPHNFKIGDATFTEVFQTTALVLCNSGGFEVWVDRSLGAFVEDWLHAAAGERPN